MNPVPQGTAAQVIRLSDRDGILRAQCRSGAGRQDTLVFRFTTASESPGVAGPTRRFGLKILAIAQQPRVPSASGQIFAPPGGARLPAGTMDGAARIRRSQLCLVIFWPGPRFLKS